MSLLSLMLSNRRQSITPAPHILQGQHRIQTSRGVVSVRDRAGLKGLAVDAYHVPKREYERIFGKLH